MKETWHAPLSYNFFQRDLLHHFSLSFYSGFPFVSSTFTTTTLSLSLSLSLQESLFPTFAFCFIRKLHSQKGKTLWLLNRGPRFLWVFPSSDFLIDIRFGRCTSWESITERVSLSPGRAFIHPDSFTMLPWVSCCWSFSQLPSWDLMKNVCFLRLERSRLKKPSACSLSVPVLVL